MLIGLFAATVISDYFGYSSVATKLKAIVWDATCPDTFAPSHRGHATRSAGCVGEQAEGKKAEKYAHLAPAYLFQPVAIETSEAIGSKSRAFLRELGRRVGLRRVR